MLHDTTLNRAYASKPAFEIEREARQQEHYFAEMRALFAKDLASKRSASIFQRTSLLLKTFFLNF